MHPMLRTLALTLGASALGAGVGAAQSRPLGSVVLLSPEEEAAFAASAAPAAITSAATILVRTARGLEEYRTGTNGYVCLVERFEQATVHWPTCYDPDAARLFIPKNRLLEEYRAAGRTVEEFQRALADAYRSGAIQVPRGGGVSYRLSPEAYMQEPGAEKRAGIWMLLISAPYATNASLGFTDAQRGIWEGVDPTFGLQATGRPDTYLWVRMNALPPMLAGGAER